MPQLQLLADLPGHQDPAWAVSFNPTRPLLASCSTDKTVRLYQYILPQTQSGLGTNESKPKNGSRFPFPKSDSSKPRMEYLNTITTEHKKSIRSIAWAPNGKTLATGSFDSSVGVWEEVDPDDEGEDEDEDEDGNEGVFRPKGIKVVDSNNDEEEEDEDDVDPPLKSSKEWECVTTLEGHESECKSVGFSSDGALLGSCSRDRSVWVWEVQPDSDFECIAVMMEHSQDVKCIAWHPHEEILASASYDSHIHLLYDDPDSDWCPFQKLHPKLKPTPLIRLLHAQNLLQHSNTNTTIRGPIEVTQSQSESGPDSDTTDFVSTEILTSILPSDAERASEAEINVPPLEEDETVWCLSWSPCGIWLASGGDEGGIRLWKRGGHQTDSPLTEILHIPAHSGPCFTLSWSKGGIPTSEGGLGLLASGGSDGRIIIWQLSKPTSSSLEPSDQEPTNNSDNKKGVGLNGVIRVWPIAAMRSAHGVADVNCLNWCIREDGKGEGMLASAGDDGSIKVWRVVE